MFPELYWLPPPLDLGRQLGEIGGGADEGAWSALETLSHTSLNSLGTLRVDRALVRLFGQDPPPGLETEPVRLAVLASSTATHLASGLRVAALRQGIWLAVHTCDYGQYVQEIMNPSSGLHRFRPDVVLFALDAPQLLAGFHPADEAAVINQRFAALIDQMTGWWRAARERLGCAVLQQTVLPVFPALLGSNEQRLPGSPARLTDRLNSSLRQEADTAGIELVAVDAMVSRDGLRAWHDPALWHRAKQEIHPGAAHVYGDLVGRILAALQGRSRKCLVLDLDNTLWGGVVGDEGVEGIVLGQGHALGEAFVAFQSHVRALAQRGIIIGVCSKNDEANAWAPFDRHPEMVLKRGDIACLAANWSDKAANIRVIAEQLKIGLNSMVFADDNPFERNMVRRELPMVAVPELPADPAHYAACLADAGYFEATRLTAEDRSRSRHYQANFARESGAASATDIDGYLRELDMEARWGRFDFMTLSRVVQLINKTNQFNLTTRRISEEAAAQLVADPRSLTVKVRLLDRHGDNGIIAVVIGRFEAASTDLLLETWLMSCRVLGRGVERTTLAILIAEARRLGAERLVGYYRPTGKNEMVRHHYARMGFAFAAELDDGTTRWVLALDEFAVSPSGIRIVEAP